MTVQFFMQSMLLVIILIRVKSHMKSPLVTVGIPGGMLTSFQRVRFFILEYECGR